ncbi:MAG TPA: metallophosphoesterase, partial [Clostridia bacterium]
MKINLKTAYNEYYLCAENGGGSTLVADRKEAREWETFEVIGPFVYGARVCFNTYNGKNFLCAADGGGKQIEVDRTEANIWESFKIIGPNGKVDGSPVNNGDNISLQTYDGIHFLCAESGGGGTTIADRTEAHEWETFQVNIVDGFHFSSKRIIHISDLHFTNSPVTFDSGTIIDFQSSKDRSNVLINHILQNRNYLGTNIVVITGDITDSGDSKDYDIAVDFINRLSNAGISVSVVPGNHDYCKEGNIVAAPLSKAALKVLFCPKCPYAPNPPNLANIINPLGTCLDSPMGHFAPDGAECPIDEYITDTSSNTKRRERFISRITHYSEYPHVIDYGDSIVILMDSMQGILDEKNSFTFAQGRLGQNQLARLRQILEMLQKERAKGKKIVVCLHHSPLKTISDDSKGGLDDAASFFNIVANKIDCILFGHTTKDGNDQEWFGDIENRYGITLINSENLEHMVRSGYSISVVDLEKKRTEVLSTDLSHFPKVRYGNLTSVPNTNASTINVHITPIVNRREASYNGSDAYPAVRFCAGDRVTMNIGGGVQDGGHGDTWRRYVNPIGARSDHLYYGLINIPGITQGLTPIRDL